MDDHQRSIWGGYGKLSGFYRGPNANANAGKDNADGDAKEEADVAAIRSGHDLLGIGPSQRFF